MADIARSVISRILWRAIALSLRLLPYSCARVCNCTRIEVKNVHKRSARMYTHANSRAASLPCRSPAACVRATCERIGSHLFPLETGVREGVQSGRAGYIDFAGRESVKDSQTKYSYSAILQSYRRKGSNSFLD